MRQTLPKSNILRGYKRFSRVINEGASISGANFLCFIALVSEQEREARSLVSIGFLVPKRKVRLAVHRNRIKRLLREAVRKTLRDLVRSVASKEKKIELVLMFKGNRSAEFKKLTAADVDHEWRTLHDEIEKVV